MGSREGSLANLADRPVLLTPDVVASVAGLKGGGLHALGDWVRGLSDDEAANALETLELRVGWLGELPDASNASSRARLKAWLVQCEKSLGALFAPSDWQGLERLVKFCVLTRERVAADPGASSGAWSPEEKVAFGGGQQPLWHRCLRLARGSLKATLDELAVPSLDRLLRSLWQHAGIRRNAALIVCTTIADRVSGAGVREEQAWSVVAAWRRQLEDEALAVPSGISSNSAVAALRRFEAELPESLKNECGDLLAAIGARARAHDLSSPQLRSKATGVLFGSMERFETPENVQFHYNWD